MKFEEKVVFIKDENYHNLRSRSPYIFILPVERVKSDLYRIKCLDLKGGLYQINQSKHWVYNKLEILEIDKISHLLKDFIRFLFIAQR